MKLTRRQLRKLIKENYKLRDDLENITLESLQQFIYASDLDANQLEDLFESAYGWSTETTYGMLEAVGWVRSIIELILRGSHENAVIPGVAQDNPIFEVILTEVVKDVIRKRNM